jgi:hypothetical protein
VIELLLERNERGDMEEQLRMTAPVSARMVYGEELVKAIRVDVMKQETANVAGGAARLKRSSHDSNLMSGLQMDGDWGTPAGGGGSHISGGGFNVPQSASEVVGNVSELAALLRLLPAGRSAVKRGANDLWGRDDDGCNKAISQVGVSGRLSHKLVTTVEDEVESRASMEQDGVADSLDNINDPNDIMYLGARGRNVGDDDDDVLSQGTNSVGSMGSNMSTTANAGNYDDDEPPSLVDDIGGDDHLRTSADLDDHDEA